MWGLGFRVTRGLSNVERRLPSTTTRVKVQITLLIGSVHPSLAIIIAASTFG